MWGDRGKIRNEKEEGEEEEEEKEEEEEEEEIAAEEEVAIVNNNNSLNFPNLAWKKFKRKQSSLKGNKI